MADDKLDISSIFGDTFKQISDALSGETQKKSKKKVSSIAGIPLPQSSSTAKKSTSKKSTSKSYPNTCIAFEKCRTSVFPSTKTRFCF